MSRFRKSFNDIYHKLWLLLDKPKLNYYDRCRCKRLLNQLFREHHGIYAKPLRLSEKDCKGGKE